MDTLVTARSAGSVSAWHAMTADEVVKQLATNTESGLDPGEAAIRMQKYGPNRLPEGKKRGAFNRLLSQFNNVLVYVLLGCGLHQADAQPVDRRSDHSRRRHIERVAWLHPGRKGGEGTRTRSATCCLRKLGPYVAARHA